MDLIPSKLRAEWAPIVRNFIIEFGGLESVISEVVRLSSTPSQFNILCNLNFSKRVDLAEAALIEWNNDSKKIVSDSFKKIREITGKRNIVAHSGFSVAIYELDNGGTHYKFGMAPTYKKSELWLTKEHLERDTALLANLSALIIEWIPKDYLADKVG